MFYFSSKTCRGLQEDFKRTSRGIQEPYYNFAKCSILLNRPSSHFRLLTEEYHVFRQQGKGTNNIPVGKIM